MKPKSSLPCSQQPATCPMWNKFSQQPPHWFLQDLCYCYPPIYAYIFQVVSFLWVYPSKILCAALLSPLHATCSIDLIPLDVTPIMFGDCVAWCTSLCIFPQAHPFLGPNIFLSTKFHTHTNRQANLQLCFFLMWVAYVTNKCTCSKQSLLNYIFTAFYFSHELQHEFAQIFSEIHLCFCTELDML
jgi:hypothetical protein